MISETWARTNDILTNRHAAAGRRQRAAGIAAPRRRRRGHQHRVHPGYLLVAGPAAVLGVPILFGVLRKELSLLMIYQALALSRLAPSSTGFRSRPSCYS